MFFRQLLDYETFTYTYLLADEKSNEAILIDTVDSRVERDSGLLKELGFNLKYIFETHVHADHITGNNQLKKLYPNSKSVLGEKTGVEFADVLLKDGEALKFGDYEIKALATPGHTDGCTSYVVGDKVFTGDTLLIRGCGRTDFQQGSNETLFSSVREKLFSLPEETLVYPGHDYKGRTNSSIGEEKRLNPRLKESQSLQEFSAIMDGLNLAHPKKIDEAVPANLQGGR